MTEQPEPRGTFGQPIEPSGGFLIPDGITAGILAMHGRAVLGAMKMLAYTTATPEELADAEGTRAGIDLMYRLVAGTATAEERAEHEKRKRERQAERQTARADAVAEWEQLRQRHADSPAILAVLDIHRPDGSDYLECELSEDDELPTNWPCTTYEAIRDAVTRTSAG